MKHIELESKVSQPRPWMQEVIQLILDLQIRPKPANRWKQVQYHSQLKPQAGFWRNSDKVMDDMEWLCEILNDSLPHPWLFDPRKGIVRCTTEDPPSTEK